MDSAARRYFNRFPAGKSSQKILPVLLKKIKSARSGKSWVVVDKWNKIVGKKYSKFTKVIKFENGILRVQVSSPSLMNILSFHEKRRILNAFKIEAPELMLKDVVFHR